MTYVIFAILCTAIMLAMAASTSNTRDMSSKDQESKSSEDKELDMQLIMNECNETFRIEMTYLESLNESGSFIDETDKTPKCYIRCMLEYMDIMSDDGMLDAARAAVLFAGERNGKSMEDIGDMTSLCADRKETCKCERAYKFLKCLMSMEIERYESTK